MASWIRFSCYRALLGSAVLVAAMVGFGGDARAQVCGTWLPGSSVPGFPFDERVLDVGAVGAGGAQTLYAIAGPDSGSFRRLYVFQNNEWTPVPTTRLPAGRLPNRIVDWNGALTISATRPGSTFPPTLPATDFYRWDGAQWTDISGGIDFQLGGAMAVYNNDLYFYAFRSSGTTSTSSIYRATGAGAATSIGDVNGGSVSAMAVIAGLLHFGGSFSIITPTTGPNVSATNIATWDGAVFDNVNFSALNGSVTDLFTWNPSPISPFPVLVVAGNFTSAGGLAANHIAIWNPFVLPDGDWATMGAGYTYPANTTSATYTFANLNISFNNNDLLIGAAFYNGSGELTGGSFDRWTGAAMQQYASIGGPVNALATYNGALVAGGDFISIAGTRLFNVGRLTGGAWQNLGTGSDGAVIDLLERNGTLYAAGDFTLIESVPANRVAYLDGTGWHAMGGGMSGQASALEVYNGSLYAAGFFQTAGGVTVNNIARWDGSAWQPLDAGTPGVNGPVSDLVVWNNQLVAVGSFTTAGGAATTYVAMWNGAAWTTFSTNFNDYVTCCTVHNNELYVGGWFNAVNITQSLGHIARWTGTAFTRVGGSPFGNGFNGNVGALASFNGELYAGGSFSQVQPGPTAVVNVARWNGTAWQALGQGQDFFPGPVYDLTVRPGGAELLVLGDYAFFDDADGQTGYNFGRWTGTQWRRMGGGNSGVADYPYCAAPFGELLCFGGGFTRPVENTSSAFFARWTEDPIINSQPADLLLGEGATATFTVSLAGDPTVAYRWHKGAIPLNNGGRFSGATGPTLGIMDVRESDAGSYSCTITNDCAMRTTRSAILSIACPADLDDGSQTGTPDGGVTIDDLLFFLALYEAGDTRGDLDDGSGTGTQDGGVTIDDLLYFLARYEGGC